MRCLLDIALLFQWFLAAIPKDLEAEVSIAKSTAHLEYMKQHFEKALESYGKCLAVVPRSNLAVQRDCVEGKARCHMKLGRHRDALECAQVLVSPA